MEPLGLTWIKLRLQDVLYDPKTKRVFTPNMGKGARLGTADAAGATKGLQSNKEDAIIDGEDRAYYKRDKYGRFASTSAGKSKKQKTKYARRSGTARMGPKERTRVSHQIATDFPKLKAGASVNSYHNRNHVYSFTVNDFGNYTFTRKTKIK